MSGNNPYEALRREASAPGTQVVEPDAKVQTIPAPETVAPPAPKPHKPGKPDVSKAPGDISYAQTVKEGETKTTDTSSTTGSKPSGGAARKNKAGEPLSNEPNFNYAQKHAEKAGDKAGEAAQKGKESLHEAGKAAKSAAGESVEAGKQAAGEAAQAAKHKAREVDEAAGEALGHAREAAGEAADAAREYAAAARDKVAEAGDAVYEQAARGVEYIKEHLPTGLGDAAASKAREMAPEDLRRRGDREALADGEKPGTVGGLFGAAKGAASYVGAKDGEQGLGDAAASKARDAAPEELVRRGDREALADGEQPGTLGGLFGAVKGAAGFVREHLPGQGGSAKQPYVREYRAGPGDFHYAQFSQAVRDKLGGAADTAGAKVHEAEDKLREARLNRPTETESQRAARYATGDSISLSDTAVDAYDSARLRSARSPVAAETRDALAGAREGVASGLGAAKDRTLDAKDSLVSGLETAKDKTAGAAQAVADRVAGAAHSVTDSLSAASDNARWAVEHTKEQVQKKADEWQAELTPTTESEARVARGEVPSDTQSLLAAKGLGAEVSHATHINRAQ
ncbi:hypothetical protein F751_4496 [Auxenochlorella protothecoides]|uniref:Uncharacterized protein n=1 Tax=Auxenochlorella protothecoides TaxID=3075 RepID=A0A087SNC2_AUXPR|nr:hypothetical protein F751_4496 [Auxenochlorella protothecoides]KFM27226.1 hypothetical protein F751_4496 [Auxenochlorella protothecoides]